MPSTPEIDLCQIPAGRPPEGVSSNFVDPPSLGPALMAVMGITVGWGIIFTGARLYINIRRLGWSDYCATIALLMAIATLGIETQQLRVAHHIWDIPACFFDGEFAKGVYIPAVLFQMGAFFAKTSILLLFHQLFSVKRPIRISIWVGHVFNFLIYAVGIAVATYFETPRIGEQWTDTLEGRTLVPVTWWQLQSALTVLLDFYIFVLPLPLLAKLSLPMKRKLRLTAVFSLALMGIAASIASLVQRIQITHSNDPTWIAAVLSLCNAVEMNVSIIVSSAPAFANFARIHLSNMTDGTLLMSLLRLSGLSRYGGGSRHDAAGTSRGIRLDADPEAMASSTQLKHDGQSGQKNIQFYELELNETWVGKAGSGATTTTTATTTNHGN